MSIGDSELSFINPRVLVKQNHLHYFVSRVTGSVTYDIAYARIASIDQFIDTLDAKSEQHVNIGGIVAQRCQGPTNPSPFVGVDNLWYLLFRNSPGVNQTRSLYLAKSHNPGGPYELYTPNPILQGDIEDPFVWSTKGTYKALVRDIGGTITGLRWPATGLMASSTGTEWSPAPKSFVCGRTVPDQSGADQIVHRLERPAVISFGGKTFLFFACLPSPSSNSVIRIFETSLFE